MRQTLAQRIREARNTKEMEQAKLAAKLDIATRTLQRWEKGDQIPDSDYLIRIARMTGVSPTWLLTGSGEMFPKESTIEKILPFNKGGYRRVKLMTLPLLASVPGGAPKLNFHPDYVDKYITVDDVNDPNAFALEVRGSSMAPRIEDGDLIVVSPRDEAHSGDICVIRVNDEDTVKRIKIEDEFVHLIPLNPDYAPSAVRKRDVSFIWKVVKVIKNL
jgi:repressor LexA